METNFNFKSSVCTSREQSERLLALGLKKETADCVWIEMSKDDWRIDAHSWKEYYSIIEEGIVPAWSLDRLRELLPKKIQYDGPLCYREYQLVITDDSVFYVSFEHNDWLLGYGESLWENMLISIEWLINEELFNKEYLV